MPPSEKYIAIVRERDFTGLHKWNPMSGLGRVRERSWKRDADCRALLRRIEGLGLEKAIIDCEWEVGL
jgi:hypothetical protein